MDCRRRFVFLIRRCTSFCQTITPNKTNSRTNSACQWSIFPVGYTNCTNLTRCSGIADAIARERKTKFNYLVGTMIEIPRAALVADQIAGDAEFFSFGTNDLTQTTLGMSRDDSG